MQSDEIKWYEFDHAEAKGCIGIQRNHYGLTILRKTEAGVSEIALIDLFYASEEGKECLATGYDKPFIQICALAPNFEDHVGGISFLEDETLLWFNKREAESVPHPAYGGIDCYRLGAEV